MKPFSQWTKQDIEEEFGISSVQDNPTFQAWLTDIQNVSDDEANRLRQLGKKLRIHVHDWNEEELKIYFIAFLLDFIDFYQPSYRPFLERELSVSYAEEKRLWGIVDFLVASGTQFPKKPVFFLHEYKKQLDTSNDPLGQLLAEMIAAQTLNSRPHPIYGAYIIGRHWYFVLLEGKTYTESLAYDATKDDIFQIVGILRHTQLLIDKIIESDSQISVA
ncbi:hypothetical protein [Candidatus Electrothrix sp.]|uniref:hypothetical protein n=1 Tax=Candidatus Electrothrix sp. TaxID=2170559 RepID=UPI0040563DB5